MRDHLDSLAFGLDSLVLAFIRLCNRLLAICGLASRNFSRQVNSTITRIASTDLMASMAIQARGFSITRVAGVLLLLLVVQLNLRAQGTDGGIFTDITDVFGGIEALYGALIVIGGYLSSFIPGLRMIDKGVYRVLAWAILTGIGFAVFGAPILSLAITYAVSTSLYETIFSLFKKSPSPDEA